MAINYSGIKLSDLINPITGVTRGILDRNAIGGATDQIVGGIDTAAQLQKDSLDRQTALYQPYNEAGLQGLDKLGQLTLNPAQFQAPQVAGSALFEGSPIAKSALFEKQFQAPTADQIRSSPGYAFELAEAQKAQERSAAARHGLVSGASLKEAARYAGGIADRYSGDEFNKALQTYGLEKDLFEGNEALKYGQSVDEYGRNKDLFEGNERIKYGQATDEYNRQHTLFNENEDRAYGRARDLTDLGMRGTAGLSGAENNYTNQITELEKAKADALAMGDLAKAQQLDEMIAGLGQTGEDILGSSGMTLGDLGKVFGIGGNKTPAGTAAPGTSQFPGGSLPGTLGSLGGIAGGIFGTAGGTVGPTAASAEALGSLAPAIPGMESIGPALAGPEAAAGGGGIGGALGSIGTLGGLVPLAAGIPIIGAGLAIGAKLLINSQAHRQADKLTGEGGIQSNLNTDLKTLADEVISGKMTQQQADPLWQQAFKAYAEQALKFAEGGGDKATVVRQMLTSYDWDPALKDLAAQFRARLGGNTSLFKG